MESYRTIVFFLICVTGIYAGSLSMRKTLYNKVLDGYNSQIRPVLDDSEPTPVNIGCVLISLVDLNEVEQSITLNGMFKLGWQDASLQWDPADYDGITKIYVEQQKVWLPDIFITNTLTTRGNLGFDKLTVQVENTGLVLWQPSGLFTLSCKTDVTYFPFDKQICKMVVSTYGSPGKDISFIPYHLQRATENHENGLWRIVNVTTELWELDDMDALPEIFVYLDLERRPVYYIVNVLLPIILLSIVSILVFFVPVDSGEKIGLCITVLLAFFVFLTVVSSILPVTSLQTPFLVIYISSLTGLSGLTLVASIIVLNVHHKPDHVSIPAFIKVWVRFMRCKRSKTSVNKVSTIKQSDSLGSEEGRGDPNENPNPDVPITEDFKTEVGEDVNTEVRISWQQVARCVDIACLVLFSAAMIISNIVFGLIMLQTVQVQGY